MNMRIFILCIYIVRAYCVRILNAHIMYEIVYLNVYVYVYVNTVNCCTILVRILVTYRYVTHMKDNHHC